jgi:hypothetical protein
MSLLLVDDRDGRIVAEIETEEQATQVLDGWARSDGSLPEYLCLVELHAHDGAILGTETTIRIRPLP